MRNSSHRRKAPRKCDIKRIAAMLLTCLAAIGLVVVVGFESGQRSDSFTTSSDVAQQTLDVQEQSISDENTLQMPDVAQQVTESNEPSCYAGMHEDTYIAGVAVINVDNMEHARDIASRLSQYSFVANATPRESDVHAGFMTVALSDDAQTLDAVDVLVQDGFNAQPNRILFATGEEPVLDGVSQPSDSPSTISAADGGRIAVDDHDSADPSPSTLNDQENAQDAVNVTDGQANSDSLLGTPADVASEEDAVTSLAYADSLSSTAVSINDYDNFPTRRWAHLAMSIYDAWSIKTGASSSVSVAIIDTGCNTTHEDLVGDDIIVGWYNAVNGTSDVTDTNGHGTHVAGIVAARANNGKGAAGVTYNGKIVPIKASSSGSSFSETDLCKAVRWAIDNKDTYNIRVINMSIGSANDATAQTYQSSWEKSSLVNLMNEANDSGILVVCSAGNDVNKPVSGGKAGPYFNYPSDYVSNCVGVVAIDSSLNKSSYSNYNLGSYSVDGATKTQDTKDICAPGDGIYSTYYRSNSDYAAMTGTSMASPAVAGVASLVFSLNPDLSPAEVSNILFQTADDLGDTGWDAMYGYGKVNAYKALWMANPSPDPVPLSGTPMYRLYNSYSGEHFYTASESERRTLIFLGWTDEGIGWTAPAEGDDVYRLYNPHAGDHHYTMSASERDMLIRAGWNYEGVGWKSDKNKSVPLYRQYNPYQFACNHNYTTSKEENEYLVSLGWHAEGVAWYGINQ